MALTPADVDRLTKARAKLGLPPMSWVPNPVSIPYAAEPAPPAPPVEIAPQNIAPKPPVQATELAPVKIAAPTEMQKKVSAIAAWTEPVAPAPPPAPAPGSVDEGLQILAHAQSGIGAPKPAPPAGPAQVAPAPPPLPPEIAAMTVAVPSNVPGTGAAPLALAPPPDGPTGYGQPAPVGDPLAAKKAAVLLPGQDAQMQHELAFSQAQLEKQAEIDQIKVDAQQKIVAEQEGALAAQQQMAAKEAEERAAFAGYYDGEMSKLQQASDKLANTKVDSQRLFKAQGVEGVFQGVAVAMAMIAGVAGASATGGVNAGVVALEKAVDRDIAAQEKDLARQEAGLARSNSLLAQKYRIFGDMQQAKAAARMDAWKLAGMRADLIAQQSGAEAAKIGAAKVKEAAERGIAREQENWNLGIEAKWQQLQAQQAQAAAAMAMEGKKRDKQVFDAQIEVAKKRAGEIGGSIDLLKSAKTLPNGNVLPPGSVVVLDAQGNIEIQGTAAAQGAGAQTQTISGFNAKGEPMYAPGQLKTKEDKKAWDETTKGYAAVKRDLAIIKELRDKHGGGEIITGADTIKANAAAWRILGTLKGPAMLNLGAVSGSDMQFLSNQVPLEPMAIGSPFYDKIGTQLTSFEESVDAAYKHGEATFVQGKAGANSALPITAPVK